MTVRPRYLPLEDRFPSGHRVASAVRSTHPGLSASAFQVSSRHGGGLAMRQLSIRSKIILTLLLTGLACLAAGGLIGYRSGATALTGSVAKQLTAQREIKKQRVQAYIRNQLRFTRAVGGYDAGAGAQIGSAKNWRHLAAVRHAQVFAA